MVAVKSYSKMFFRIFCLSPVVLFAYGCGEPIEERVQGTGTERDTRGNGNLQAETDGDFQHEIARLREKAEERALAEARGQIDRQALAVEIGLEWPSSEVTATKEEIQAKAKQLAEQEADEKFPKTGIEEFKAEAAEEYPAYERNDEVKIIIRGGRGSDPTVEGAFMDVTEDRVKIGSRWVLKRDIKPEDLAKFDEDVRDRMRQEYIQRKTTKFLSRRSFFIKDKFKEILRDEALAAGYQEWRGRLVDPHALLDAAVEKKVNEMAADIQPGIEQEMLEEAGFVLKEGEWKPSLTKRLL